MKKLIAFKASWCGPCKMLTPILKDLQAEGYNIEMVDVDEQTERAEENQVLSIPTLDFYNGNKRYLRTVGFKTKEQLIKHFKEVD
jgi:thioredoxin 1